MFVYNILVMTTGVAKRSLGMKYSYILTTYEVVAVGGLGRLMDSFSPNWLLENSYSCGEKQLFVKM